MNAIISNGDYTALVQVPVDRKQLAGALSYLGKNHASAYDIECRMSIIRPSGAEERAFYIIQKSSLAFVSKIWYNNHE